VCPKIIWLKHNIDSERLIWLLTRRTNNYFSWQKFNIDLEIHNFLASSIQIKWFNDGNPTTTHPTPCFQCMFWTSNPDPSTQQTHQIMKVAKAPKQFKTYFPPSQTPTSQLSFPSFIQSSSALGKKAILAELSCHSPEKTREAHPYLRKSATHGNTNWAVLSTEWASVEGRSCARESTSCLVARLIQRRKGITVTILWGVEFVCASRGNSLALLRRAKLSRVKSHALQWTSDRAVIPGSAIDFQRVTRVTGFDLCNYSMSLMHYYVVSR
jgi:hypothetical protein